jgi:hypothetical protein
MGRRTVCPSRSGTWKRVLRKFGPCLWFVTSLLVLLELFGCCGVTAHAADPVFPGANDRSPQGGSRIHVLLLPCVQNYAESWCAVHDWHFYKLCAGCGPANRRAQ